MGMMIDYNTKYKIEAQLYDLAEPMGFTVAENKADIKKIDDNLGVMGNLTIYEINILGDKNVRSL